MQTFRDLTERRRFLRRFMLLLQRVFARAEITGLENIPDEGPLLILFNHLSILDGPLVVGNIPRDLELVGPGDFPMTAIEKVVIDSYGISLVNRGRTDRQSLKIMVNHLRNGKMLAMAPDGGTWEKRLHEVKPGAAYLSQLTQSPMLPIGLGGMYDIPVPSFKTLMARPRVTVNIGQVLPPVPPSKNRRSRDADLAAASQDIMQAIYGLLPPEDQDLYDYWTRATYDLQIDLIDHDGNPVGYDGPPLPDMTALGEFAAKPNLFRVMRVNAGVNVEVFEFDRFFAPIEVQITARQLRDTLLNWPYEVYLDYRLGEDKAVMVLEALAAFNALCHWAMDRDLRMRLTPIIKDS
jgi:1-acyl-sn-glycerol-3-phosphate acyltransferase